MALTVGTDSYAALATVDTYHSNRGNTEWAAVADATREVYIRQATDYIDRTFSFIGDLVSITQRLKWPREFAEIEGHLIANTEIPWQLEEATAIMAELYRQGTFDFAGVVTNDTAAVQRQKVDVIEVAYDTTKRLQGSDVPSHVFKLLRPLTRGQGGLARA